MIYKIAFSTDLTEVYPGKLGKLMNEMRVRMETACWKAKWRKAEADSDYEGMDRLDKSFNLIGLP